MMATIIATAVAFSGLQPNTSLRLNGWAAALLLTHQNTENGPILPSIYLKNFKKGSKTEISPPWKYILSGFFCNFAAGEDIGALQRCNVVT